MFLSKKSVKTKGIGLILPLESKMATPKSFPAIMWSVHLFVATVVSAFGLVGYLAFYNCTQGESCCWLLDDEKQN